jgi:XTP/dITP diphosphohydrolase
VSEALAHLVAIMDRLRSPGGCPWDAEQDHRSLVTYLVEEAYELIEAIETDDRESMLEELGDVLLQVVFHARIASEHPDSPFDIDDVARVISEKLVARHQHVFGDVIAETSDDVVRDWERLKAQEKGRTSAVDGVPMAQPALALAQKLMHRVEKHHVDVAVSVPIALPPAVDENSLGDLLWAVAALANEHGLDAEAALRSAARRYVATVRAVEGDSDPQG